MNVPGDTAMMASPFKGATLPEAEDGNTEGGMDSFSAGSALTSPFAEGLGSQDESSAYAFEFEELVAELAGEEFDEAVEALVDEAAGRHLRAVSSYATQDGEVAASAEVTDWVGAVGGEVDQLLANLEREYADTSPAALSEQAVAEMLSVHGRMGAASEQFLGGVLGKVASAAGALAKRGLAGLGKLLPLGKLFSLVRQLVKPLLKRVLAKALNRLPAGVRGIATGLAAKYGLAQAAQGEGESEIAEAFDRELAQALLAPTDSAESAVIGEAVAVTEVPVHYPLATLDAARSRLARQLLEAEPGRPPTEQLEQFIPAVMAALPLIRTGIRVAGLRDRIKRVLANGIATLIQTYVGPAAARTLAPHVAETGLRLLSLEHEAEEMLGAEGLVDTVEETIATVASLPEEALEDPALLRAELGEAFEAAAVRHLPAQVLLPDLPAQETTSGEGEWVLMPRGAAQSRRYRKFSEIYDVSMGRPTARAIALPGEDTLEERLLDAGVESWPVRAEVHLFEETPGTRMGHLAAFEGADVTTDEFELLTPETSALLTGEPGLGRQPPGPARTAAGRRLFRLVVPGRRVRRGVRRIGLRLLARQPRPTLCVSLRVGERTAHALVGPVSRKAPSEALTLISRLLHPQVRRSMAERLTRMLSRATGQVVPPARGEAVAEAVATAMLATLSAKLPESAAALAAAAKDPAPGLTLTFDFSFRDRAALASGLPENPALTIRPGVRRG
jgi:hypothetical protein